MAGEILGNQAQLVGGQLIGLPNFSFMAQPWNGVEDWERYETRVLSQAQDAFQAYLRYTAAVAGACGLSTPLSHRTAAAH